MTIILASHSTSLFSYEHPLGLTYTYAVILLDNKVNIVCCSDQLNPSELKIDCSKNDIADIYQWQKFFELSTQILKKTLAEKKVKLLSLGKILSLILPAILGLATILGIALDIFSYIDADEKDLKNHANFITIGQQISANGKASKNQYLEVMQAIEKKQTLITALRSVSIAKKKAFIIRMTIFLSLGRKWR